MVAEIHNQHRSLYAAKDVPFLPAYLQAYHAGRGDRREADGRPPRARGNQYCRQLRTGRGRHGVFHARAVPGLVWRDGERRAWKGRQGKPCLFHILSHPRQEIATSQGCLIDTPTQGHLFRKTPMNTPLTARCSRSPYPRSCFPFQEEKRGVGTGFWREKRERGHGVQCPPPNNEATCAYVCPVQ